MKKVLFVTNYASPYRVHFFDALSEHYDVTVLFSDRGEEQAIRDARWFVPGEGRFHHVLLTKKMGSLGGENLCADVISWLKKPFDKIVICGYSSPTAMLAMAWLRLCRIPFYMEVDGGLIREDSRGKYLFKKAFVSAATWWIGSGDHTTKYLVHYGAKEDRVFTYPFSSLWEKDILREIPSVEEKQRLRRKLSMEEAKIALYVGRFDPMKGMDDLLAAAPGLGKDTGLYFVGGEPTADQLRFCKENGLSNVHFVGFRKKDALADYYKAADVLVLPTKSDVWGLVINEAMACGLPVVTTDKCVAGLELVRGGVNGYIVPVDDREAMVDKINAVLAMDYRKMGMEALETIRPYTIENMVKAHVEIFESGR